MSLFNKISDTFLWSKTVSRAAAVVVGRGWARVGSMPPAGMGPSGEQDTTGQGLVELVVFSQRLVCIPRISRGQTYVPWVQSSKGLCRAEPLRYLLSEMRSSAGDGGKADGGGGGGTTDTNPSPRSSVRFSWQGATRGREPSLRARGVRHHHHINNERAAPSKLFAPALARAQNAEKVREPHPKQPQGEHCDAWSVLCQADDPK